MSYSAVKAAKSFAATHAVQLSEKQHKAFVDALAKLLVEAHNIGYHKGEKNEKHGNLFYLRSN